MSFYHIKNIRLDKKNNHISADLADSCWEPLDYFHLEEISDEKSYEKKYADFIYNLVSGNFHPQKNNKYSKLVMNKWLENYYDDANDMGRLETYNKYKHVITDILNDNSSQLIILKSDRELNPEKYYVLSPIVIDTKYEGNYYTNSIGQLFNVSSDSKLYVCNNSDGIHYGEPIYPPNDINKFLEYNSSIFEKSDEICI